jgi:hypothetical protein
MTLRRAAASDFAQEGLIATYKKVAKRKMQERAAHVLDSFYHSLLSSLLFSFLSY